MATSNLIPKGAWDSHVHVVDEDRFPLHPSHPYRPAKAPVTSLETFHRQLGIEHACLVSVSVYDNDPASILDALAYFQGKSRAVITLDPRMTNDQLEKLHQAGVRGVRINLHTERKKLDIDHVISVAQRVRPFGWALQLYISLPQMVELAPLVPRLGVPVIIDHLASPQPSLGSARLQPGYEEFISLLQKGLIWTKLSGTYRFADLPDLDGYVATLLKTAPDQIVWASDWPHTSGVQANEDGNREKVQPYRKVDDEGWVQRCAKWCKEVGSDDNGKLLAQKIWVDNPRRLWQWDP